MNLPIVWNSNSYGTKILWKLVNGLVDCYVIDLKFGNDNCARELAGCKNHNYYTLETLNSLIKSAGRKIIRWLLLPGHIECCGKNITNMLSKYDFYVSLVDDFSPSYKMKPNRLNTEAEITKAREMLRSYQLNDINNPIHSNTFWK
jgi:putative pyruvate formate lyase activating enzyme